jgi:transcription-repair coupling factor (superfamily II helicase)
VEKLEAGPKGLVVAFRHNKFENPAGLISWLATQRSAPTADLKLRPDHKLALAREMTVPQRLKAAKDILSTLNRLATPAKAA